MDKEQHELDDKIQRVLQKVTLLGMTGDDYGSESQKSRIILPLKNELRMCQF